MYSGFRDILEKEWKSRTTDNTATVRRLTAELREKHSMQEKLFTAYLKGDKNVLPVYDQMSRKFQDDIALLESQIAEANTENATFEQLWEFSQNLLVDIPTAYKQADVSQKQRVQNILFPSGLKYHPEKGILNSDKDSLFSYLEDFNHGKITMARPERFELPT
jgi:hypothetical protein